MKRGSESFPFFMLDSFDSDYPRYMPDYFSSPQIYVVIHRVPIAIGMNSAPKF